MLLAVLFLRTAGKRTGGLLVNMMRVWACKVYPPFVYACVSGSGRRRGGNELCLLLLALVSRMVS